MSNKQNKLAKKKKKQKENIRKKNIKNNTASNIDKARFFSINGNIRKKKYLSFPISAPTPLNNKNGVEMLQATTLYYWNNHKIRAPKQYREALNDFKSTLEEDNQTIDLNNNNYLKFVESAKKSVEMRTKAPAEDSEYYDVYYKKYLDMIEGNTKYVKLLGVAVDVKYGFQNHKDGKFYKNVVNSICIADVKALDPISGKKFRVSDHMWLFLDKMISELTVQFHYDQDMSIHIGDSIGIIGELVEYRDRETREKRYGVGWWFLDYSSMDYYLINQKNIEFTSIPKIIPRRACLCQINYYKDGLIFDGRNKSGIRSKIEEDIEYLNKLGLEHYGDPIYEEDL